MASARSVSCCIAVVALLFGLAEATEYLVGGKANAWKVPSSEVDSLNKWAEANRFLVGDSLVWKSKNEKDSVLQVTREAYQSCNTSNPIAASTGGDAKVILDRSGPFYFISGDEGNCEKGEKLIVVVLSSGRRGFFSGSPAPAPMDYDGPAIAPTSAASVLKSSFVGSFVILVGMLLL